MESYKDTLLQSDDPNVKELNRDYRRSFTDERSTARIQANDEVRYAVWDGQTVDGRKHASAYDGPVFPWEGSSDSRVRHADMKCRFIYSLLMLAWKGGRINVQPVEYTDSQMSELIQLFMAWDVDVRLKSQLEREFSLFLNAMTQYGYAAFHTTWERKLAIVPRTIDIADVFAVMVQQGMIDPTEDPVEAIRANDAVIELNFRDMFPDMKTKDVREFLKELLEKGKADLYLEEVVKDCPRIWALRPYYDIIFPPETQDIQRARVIFRRDWINMAELTQYKESGEWDEDFCDAVEKTAGMTQSSYMDALRPANGDMTRYGERQNMIEIIYAYSRRIDDNGRVGIYQTIFSPGVMKGKKNAEDLYAKHEIVTEAGEEYPFDVFTYEDIQRNPMESRGIPEIEDTNQSEKKEQRDAVINYTHITTLPPMEKPVRYGQHLEIGPGTQVVTHRRGELGWMEPPSPIGVEVALKVQQAVDREADIFHGIPNAEVPPQITQMIQQSLVARWLAFVGQIYKRVWRQNQRFCSDAIFQRVTGSNIPIPRDQSDIDIQIAFDSRDLDPDFLDKKLQAITNVVLPNDSAGVINRAELTRMQLNAIDPSYTRGIVSDQQAATRQMYNEVQGQVMSMLLGNDPILTEMDPSAQTKVRILEQIIAQNDLYQNALRQDGGFSERMNKYLENLNFSIAQRQNAATGKYGTQSGNTQQALGIR